MIGETGSALIKASEAKKQQQINEAEGAATAIREIASATAEGIRRVAEAIQVPGGYEAVQLRVAPVRLVRSQGLVASVCPAC